MGELYNAFQHYGDSWYDATLYAESHDEVGNTDDRIAKRARDGKGWEMNQLSLTGVVLARGVPMVFMGQEAGEWRQFHIDWSDDRLDLDDYETNSARVKIMDCYRRMNQIRTSDLAAFTASDQYISHLHHHNGVFAFTRNNGAYAVVMNFGGTTYRNYDVGISGNYREIANTSWPQFNLGGVAEASRGTGTNNISKVHIPAYGAVILKRESSDRLGQVNITFECRNGYANWGQSVYVVGNTPQLGNWDASNALQLDAANYPTWTKTFAFDQSSNPMSWKCLKRNESDPSQDSVWEPGADNGVVPSSDKTTIGQF